MPAGSTVTIHTDSDAADSTSNAMLNPGQFAQVPSASSSTEIANDGAEADVFYTDGVNWGSSGVPYHAGHLRLRRNNRANRLVITGR